MGQGIPELLVERKVCHTAVGLSIGTTENVPMS